MPEKKKPGGQKNPTSPAMKGSRATSTRHPLLQGRARNVWHADLAGVVPYYPKTLEKFQRRQEIARKIWPTMMKNGTYRTRAGVPDGFAGRREEVAACRAKAVIEGKEIVAEMKKNGQFVPEGTPTDMEMASEALAFAVATMRAHTDDGKATYTIRDRQAAAALILAYTKSKPAQIVSTTVHKAEDFLSAMFANIKAG